MRSKFEMQRKAVDHLLSLLPDQVSFFNGSEYPLPVKTAFIGDCDINVAALCQELKEKAEGDAKELLEPLLLAAELYEASCEDKGDYFIKDRDLRSFVFMGSKWQAGWVLVLGGRDSCKTIDLLMEKDFMVFTDTPGIKDTFYIGSRDTSPIYFLQIMVRYGLIWGRIAPGDDHEMGHFLEKDLPGFIMINEDLPDLKYIITLGLMKMGAPAVIPSTFPFPYGNRSLADSIEDRIDRGIRFPNLRHRYYNDETIRLPDFCNTANTKEKVVVRRQLGGSPVSFFCVQPAIHVENTINIVGQPSEGIGIYVLIENEHLSEDVAWVIEQTALKSVNYMFGVKAYEKDGVLYIGLASEGPIDSHRIGEAVYWGIRLHYPRLEKISIDIIYDQALLRAKAEKVRSYKVARREAINNMKEENTDQFCACTECRPFSLVHTCILTPDSLPMCASRTYFTTKAAASLGLPDWPQMWEMPYKRPSEKDLPLKHIFNKGKVLDAEKGEYEGCNAIYSQFTGGKLTRVYLHSLREYPHTSCGCFQNLAFWLDEIKGIGIMCRNSAAVTPDGRTWDDLANYAGGKQSDGIMGVSIYYIRSANFLKGDGGIRNVVWVDNELYGKVADVFLPGQRVATEKDVGNMEQLYVFVNNRPHDI